MDFAVRQPNCTVVKLCRIGRTWSGAFHGCTACQLGIMMLCRSENDPLKEVCVQELDFLYITGTWCLEKRGNMVLSAPILAWGKLCGLLVSCHESWQRQVRHTLARNTNHLYGCGGPCSLGNMKACGRRGKRAQVSLALLFNSCRYQAH